MEMFIATYCQNRDYDEALATAAEGVALRHKVNIHKAYEDLQNIIPEENELEEVLND